MQNTYTYWRATHPLVFVSAHLIVGTLIAQLFPQYSNEIIKQCSIFVFSISLIVIFFISKWGKNSAIHAFLISIIMISWGIVIYFNAQINPIFSIPYPQNIITCCQGWVIEKINKTIISKEANGFALAILLGVKINMDKHLVTAYTQLGIIHIIAISGMHLEILFKNLKRITGLLPRNKIFLILELIILLICVWTYTLMAFASPSIVRASVFFTIFTVGKFIGANTFMLNTIAGGLLFLILFDINGIHNIGLQLSYAAVIGINLFYNPLSQLISINNPIIKFCWSNCCVSVAAQLTTFPILAIHFHQVAGWVLVSNFIMVPLSNFILYALGLLLILPYQFKLTFIWGRITEKYILFFNQMVSGWFSHTKAGTVQISMGKSEIALYYLLLLFVYLWLYLKRPRYILGFLGSFCCYFLLKLFS